MKTFIPESIPLEGVALSAPKLPARSAALQGAWASRPHRSNPVGGTPTLLELPSPARPFIFANFAVVLCVLLTLAAFLLPVSNLQAQITFTGTYTFGADGNVASFNYNGAPIEGLAISAITKNGVTTSSSSGNFRASQWPIGATAGSNVFTGVINTAKYIEFSLSPTAGYKLNMSSVSFGMGRSTSGTRQAEWRSSLDGFLQPLQSYASLHASLTNNSGVLTCPDLNSGFTGNTLNLTASNYQELSQPLIFRIYFYNSVSTTGTGGLQGPLTFSGSLLPPAGVPNISTSANLQNFSTPLGLASAPQSFNVTASSLESDILVQAPPNFEVSTNNTTFSSNVSLAPTGGNATGTVFARISGSAPQGPVSGNITLTSTNATTRNVSVSGSVRPATVTIPHTQTFDVDSEPWFAYNVAGSANWARVAGTMQINGFGSNVAANDWLIIGPFNFSTATNPGILFNTLNQFTVSGTVVNELSLKISTNYSGTGDPSGASWTSLNFQKPAAELTKSTSGLVPLTGAAGQNGVYVAFHYVAGGTANGTTALWQVDDVTIGNNLTPPPILTPVTLSGPLSTTAGTPSSAVSFTANGSNLTANITATAQTGFDVSTDNITFTPSVSAAAPATVFIRFSSTRPTGIYNNTIAAVLSSANATNVNVTTSATGNTVNAAPTPTITPSTAALSGFTTTNGTASAAQSFTVNGTNLSADITATAPPSFELSNNNSTFGPSATLAQTVGSASGTIFVRLAASAPVGTPSGNITLTSTGATNRLVAVAGNVNSPDSGAPVVAAASFNGAVGAAFSANITATNTPNSFSAGSALPAGLTLNPTTGSISGTPTAAGNSSVVVSASNGNGTGNATISFTIAKGSQQILGVTPIFSRTLGALPYSLNATVASNLPITYSTSNSSVATVATNGTVTILAVGTTTLTASQAGDANWNAAPNATQTLTVVPPIPVFQTNSFNATVGLAFTGTINATNSPTSYSATLPGGLTLNSATGAISGTPTAAGNFSINATATNAGGTANGTLSFNIAKGNQTISGVSANQSRLVGAPPYSLNATINSALTILYSSSNTSVATISPDGTVTIAGVGTTILTASQAGDANWNPAPNASQALTVTEPVLPTLNLSPASLGNFTAISGTPSANQTFTVNGTNLEGVVNIAAPAGYEISRDGNSYSSSLAISPDQPSGPVVTTITANDTASNYGTPASNTWGNGSNAGTGFQPWLFNVVNNSTGTPPPAFYAGAFIGNATTAGITNMPAPSFGLYANPGGTAATATVSRAFAQAMAVGDSFSFQWATNWDSDVGNKGFNIFAGGSQVVNVNQAGFPGNITCNGQLAIDGTSGYGSSPMTWTFTRTTLTNLQVTSTARNGTPAIVFSSNITISAAPEGFSFYTTAMGQGDQRQPYFNNLKITSSTAIGGNLTNTPIFVRLTANATIGPVSGNISVSSTNATQRTVALTGAVSAITVNPAGPLSFNTVFTQASNATTVAVTGTSLSANITAIAPANFEVSTNNSSFGPNATLAPAGGNLFLRIAASAPVGSFSGNLALSSGGVSRSIALQGTVVRPLVSSNTTSLPAFRTTDSAASVVQSFSVNGTNLLANILITAPAGFEVSTDNSTFGSNASITASSGNAAGTVFVRIPVGTSPASLSGNITLSSAAALDTLISLSGTVIPTPALVPSASSISGLRTISTQPSEPASFTLNATNLSGNVTIAASAGFEVATSASGSYSSLAVLSQGNGTLSQEIFVRLASGGGVAQVSGNLTLTTPDTAAVLIALSGEILTTPVLAASPASLSGLLTTDSRASIARSFTLNASSLQGNITITAPAQFEVSTDNSTFAATAILSASSGNLSAPVFVRIASGVSINPSLVGNITLTSIFANPASVSLSGSVIATPALSTSVSGIAGLRTISSQPSDAASFSINATNLAGNITLSASTGFEISTTLNGTFSRNATLTGGNGSLTQQLFVRLASGGTVGLSNGTLTIQTSYLDALSIPLSGEILKTPVIAVSPSSLPGFFTTDTRSSSAQSFTVNATDLQGNITISAPPNFEVSTNNSTFGSNATLTSNSSNLTATVFARIASGVAQNPALSGNISLDSLFATRAQVGLSGNVIATPVLTALPASLTGLKARFGKTSSPVSLTINGTNLTGNVTLQAPEHFEIATDNLVFLDGLVLAPQQLQTTGGLQIFVRIKDTAPLGALADHLSVASQYAETLEIELTGLVELGPVIELIGVEDDLPRFTTSDGIVSAPQTFSVNASNLTEAVEITAPLHFEIAVGNGNFSTIATIPQSGGNASGTISVRVSNTALVGNLTGTIYLTSREAVTRRVGVYATVTPKLTLTSNLETLIEGDEYSEAQITLRRSGPVASSLTVNLTENLGSLLQADLVGDLDYKNLPVDVTIPAGAESAEFYVRARENSIRAGKSRLIATATGLASASVNFTLTENDPGSSYMSWLNGAQHSSKNLELYALGSGALVGQSQLPALTMNGSHSSLSAIVRADDPWLRVLGEWTNDLKNGPWTPANLSADSNRTGLSTGFERRFFSVPILPGETRKFLRLRVELQD